MRNVNAKPEKSQKHVIPIFHEYEYVVLNRDCADLKKGAKGLVIDCMLGEPPTYTVEFTELETCGLLRGSDLKRYEPNDRKRYGSETGMLQEPNNPKKRRGF